MFNVIKQYRNWRNRVAIRKDMQHEADIQVYEQWLHFLWYGRDSIELSEFQLETLRMAAKIACNLRLTFWGLIKHSLGQLRDV